MAFASAAWRFLVPKSDHDGYHQTELIRRGAWMNEELRQTAEVAKSPDTYNWLTYMWVCVVSGWGGLVRFLNSMRDSKETARQAVLTLVTGLVTSTFVGVLTFWLCEMSDFPPLATAVCIAVTGHAGAEALRAIQDGVLSRLAAAWKAATTNPGEKK